MKDPYEVLGLDITATEDEIKAAYRLLVRRYHPDQYAGNPLAFLAQEKLKEINEAYGEICRRIREKPAPGEEPCSAAYGRSNIAIPA